jgi:DNA-binding transcriptional regulator GbsR (MarR family)
MMEGTGARDPDAVLAFIERFASVLTETGWPRMPARVFVALLASDAGRRTAAELGETLRVSPAAISGAVRYLVRLNLASRERDPGSRRDLYRVNDDVWYEAAAQRDQMLARYYASLREGVKVLGADTPAAHRLTETLAFFEFIGTELHGIVDRWQARRDEMRAAWAAATPRQPAGGPTPSDGSADGSRPRARRRSTVG